MADDYPNDVSQPTLTVEVDESPFYIQAQHSVVNVNTEKLFGSRPAIASMASVGSTVSRAAAEGRESRPASASEGSVASVASAASTASLTGTISQPSIASQGSAAAIASVASQASVAVAASAGSVAGVAGDASTINGSVILYLRAKQQPVTVKVEGDKAAYVIAGSLPANPVDRMNAHIIPAWGSDTFVAKKTPEGVHSVEFPEHLII